MQHEGAADDLLESLHPEAAKRREANRKKRDKLKAKKKAGVQGPSADGVPGGRAERREAGAGRGMGMFALEPIGKGETISSAPAALTVAFDAAATKVCSFCFARPSPVHEETLAVTLTRHESGYGLVLNDIPLIAGDGPYLAVVTHVRHDSPNEGVVRVGDRVRSVRGAVVEGGQEKAAAMLLEAARECADGRGHAAVPCVIVRPAVVLCTGCCKCAVCASCLSSGMVSAPPSARTRRALAPRPSRAPSCRECRSVSLASAQVARR